MAELPGPCGPPVFGQAFNLDSDHLHLQFLDWKNKFGDIFMFKVMGKHFLVVSHPDILKDMFITCENADKLNDRPRSFMGSHVIGETRDIVFRNWDEEQKVLKQAAKEYIDNTVMKEDWFCECLKSEMSLLVKEIESKGGTPADILNITDTCATKIVCAMLAGHPVEATSPEFQCVSGFMRTSNELGTVKNQTLLTTLPFIRKCPGRLRDVYNSMKAERSKLREYFIDKNKSDCGLVHMLKELSQQLKTQGKDWLTDDFIMGVIMDHTAAAIVPLQNTLSALFLLLVHHIDLQDKIRACAANFSTPPTLAEVEGSPYIRACVLELKRWHTPLPLSARHCVSDNDVKYKTYTIPKDTAIFSNLFGINHDERFWDDPWSYKPERFLTENGQLIPDDHPNMTNLNVTGVGPRACVAAKFSNEILAMVLVTSLQNMSVLPCDSQKLPPCDPRKFLPGVVTRAPDFECQFRNQLVRGQFPRNVLKNN